MKDRLSDAIDAYETFRRSQGVAKNTLKNDRQSLLALLSNVGNIYTDHVRHEAMTEFLASRFETRSPNSMRTEYTVLRCFFRWAEDTRRVTHAKNPMLHRKLPKKEKRLRARMSISDFPHFLEVAGKRSPRDRAFIAIALLTMLRSSEIVSLRVDDLRLNDSRLRVKIHKSRDFDEVPVNEQLDAELRRWLMVYQDECGPLQSDWYLVPARKLVRFPGFDAGQGITALNPTRPLSNPTAQIVKPALHACGFQIEGNPTLRGEGAHTIRRSAARALYDRLASEGFDEVVGAVMTTLHHQSRDTTETYLGVSGYQKRRDDIFLSGPLFPGLPGQIEIGATDDGQGEGLRAAL